MDQSTRFLRAQSQPISYTEHNLYSRLEPDDEHNDRQNINTLSSSSGSIESTSVTDMATPTPHEVTTESSSARKRIQQACDACRRKKSKCTGGQVCHECQKAQRICTYTPADNSEPNRTVSYREYRILQQRNNLLEWALEENHARSLLFPEMGAPDEFSQYIPWLQMSPLTPPFKVETSNTTARSRYHKRTRMRKNSSKLSSLDQHAQEPLRTDIANNTTGNTEHNSEQAEVPHFRDGQPALDINVIDNGLEAHAYNQGHSPSSPGAANKIDYNMEVDPPSFDQSFYSESYHTNFVPSSAEHFSHSPYTATTTQHDHWNEGSNVPNMANNGQMSDQDMLYSHTQYFPSNNHYDYSYSHHQQ